MLGEKMKRLEVKIVFIGEPEPIEIAKKGISSFLKPYNENRRDVQAELTIEESDKNIFDSIKKKEEKNE